MARRNGGFIGTDGLDAPDPPTGVSASGGDAQVSVAFTAPTDTGTSAITGFVAQVSTDGTAYSAGSGTGTSSPIVVSSLTNGTAATAKVWAINAYGTSSPSDASDSFTPVASIGLFGGGVSQVTIEQINITTEGNSSDFGDLTVGTYGRRALGSETRGVWGGGEDDTGKLDVIDYVTFASAGNATDFGNLTDDRQKAASFSNSTRGIWAGGDGGNTVIDYITIASAGNATDFGDPTQYVYGLSGLASATRGVYGAGYFGGNFSNKIDYITIASTGNGSDFGDLTQAAGSSGNSAVASSTRGLFAAYETSGGASNVIDYITIASTGNATDFGDLTDARHTSGGVSSSIRAVWGPGSDASPSNVMDFVTIATTGNAADFGDMQVLNNEFGACSNTHGGLA